MSNTHLPVYSSYIKEYEDGVNRHFAFLVSIISQKMMRSSNRSLVPVSLEYFDSYTSGLSTWWSTRELSAAPIFDQRVIRLFDEKADTGFCHLVLVYFLW